MYTRVVEFTSKSGKAKELSNTINEKAVPILKKQNGFVDEIVLVSDAEQDRVLGLSFWNAREDAERYHRAQYPQIHEMLKHLLEPNRSSERSTSTPRPPTESPQVKRPEALGGCFCSQPWASVPTRPLSTSLR